MENITKEEMVDILKDSISWLEKDVSDIHHDLRDYERLDGDDYDYIANEILGSIECLLSKKRSMKIKKIKERL